MRTFLAIVTPALFLLACGGGAAPPQNGSSGGDAPPESCGGYSLGQACVTEENLAQCREMEARCPGRVLVRESCPLQFACP